MGVRLRAKEAAAAGLPQRLAALDDALELAEGRLDPGDVALGRSVQRRSQERLGLAPEVTVAALAGATGSGKSSLFNAVVGEDLADVGVRRPTTGEAQACLFGEADADALLDWLDIHDRYLLDTVEPELDGLLLIDLPDHDSTAHDHRLEVDRLVELVDLLVWVVDPQKYADRELHQRYLRPLATHSGVTVVVLNHADRLDDVSLKRCLTDLRRLLREDGLDGTKVLASSATTGWGVDELKRVLRSRVREHRAVTERVAADVDLVVHLLGRVCTGAPEPLAAPVRTRLYETLARAASTDLVADAVGRAFQHRSRLVTGWPFTRWLNRMRPDPLARLHLKGPRNGDDRTSLPSAPPVQRSRISTALRAVGQEAGQPLPEPWPGALQTAAMRHEEELPDLLDRAVARTDLGIDRPPLWWRTFGFLQWLFAAVAVVGALWLLLLFVAAWIDLPDPPTYELQEIPLPTILFVGGNFIGIVLAGVGAQVARVGAQRRRWVARRRLDEAVKEVADAHVIAPVEEELEVYRRFCAAITRARRKRR